MTPTCNWCARPIAEGKGRYRFYALSFHAGCWDSKVAERLVQLADEEEPS
jgi:hypothetical protein